jgi:hypothetical protein
MTMLTPDFSSRPETPASNEVSDPITELLRGHARELIAAALEAAVQSVLHRLCVEGSDVVRNGYCRVAWSPRPSVTWRSTSPGSVRVTVKW